MDEHTPELITASQARRLLGVSKPTLARLIREGVLSTTKSPLDKRVKLVRASDVATLLQFERQRQPEGINVDHPHQRQRLTDPQQSAPAREAEHETGNDAVQDAEARKTD